MLLAFANFSFPGIRPFSATSVAGVQPIKLTLYTTRMTASAEKNPQRDILFAMEVSNAIKSTLGNEARGWISENSSVDGKKTPELPPLDEVAEPSDIDFIRQIETFEDIEEMEQRSEATQDGDIEDLEEDDEGSEMDDEMLDNIETGCYLLSGSPISLREETGSYVASGGGYAVLQSSPTSSIVLEKLQKKKKGDGSHPTMIRNGDIVRVKLADATSKAVKYLSLHRGWWLRWTTSRPKRNGLFYIRTDEPNGSLVVLGCPFSLVSRRWSHYLIGACVESSAKYGGRMLGIYKAGKSSAGDEAGYGEEDDGSMQDLEDDKDHPTEKMGDKRMTPLFLCAEAYYTINEELSSPVSPGRASKFTRQISEEEKKLLVPTLRAPGFEHNTRYEM